MRLTRRAREFAYRPTPADQLGGLPIFARPAPAVEQRQLRDEKFERWLETLGGRRAWEWIQGEALCRAADGEQRIGVKSLVEDVRDTLHISVNNSFTGLIGRRLVERHPHLKGLIELRERAA